MLNDNSILNCLQKQQQLLALILDSLNKPQLGLHSHGGSWKIYCNRQHKCLWYRLVDSEPVPILETSLTGYIKSLRFETYERRKKSSSKLLLEINADRHYILEAGHDTQFSKGLLFAIASLEVKQLIEPITIMPVAGNEESVLFCRLSIAHEFIKTSYDEETDWREIAIKAINNVKAANLR